jgi:transposase-like protein
LGRLGWPLRRIEAATGVRRETASAYLKAAGIPVRLPRRRRPPAPKPAESIDLVYLDPPFKSNQEYNGDPGRPAALRDGQKVILAVEGGYRESTENWAAILRDLKRRGLQAPKLVIGDGHLGIWGALAAVFPEAKEQRCWNHRVLNVLAKLPLKRQAAARSLLTKIPYAETRADAERQKRAFQALCTKHGHADAGRALDRDWERMVTFYDFPREHWKHLRTSNPVESPFAAARLRTTAAKRFNRVENAIAVIWICISGLYHREKKVAA